MRAACITVLIAAAVALPARVQAQTLRAQCTAASRAQVQTFCEQVADGVLIIQPRLGLALSGGNPVPGTASTLGMRIGALPRVGIGLRVSAAQVDLPPVERVTSTADISFPLGGISADATVGLYQGMSLLPTVGGFGSVDLLASVGVMPLPHGEGFDDTAPVSWALGARVGILRESFTAPGVSVSAMYRRLGDLTYGSSALSDTDAFFRMRDNSVTSIRAAVGKRVLGVGLTGGAGWDRYSSDVLARVRDPEPLAPGNLLELAAPGLSQSRTSLFGNISFTLLILNMAAEIGWQDGRDRIEGASDKLEKRGLFGGLALRLTI
jgi:hypothetical protein